MAFRSPAEFRTLLTGDLDAVASAEILDGEPFAFREEPAVYDRLVAHLCNELPITPEQVYVVGSGRVGFSLHPARFPRAFNASSDIDVAVVNADLFDLVWYTMLRWNYPRRYRLGGTDLEWQQGRMDDLYWGWFRPEKFRFEGLSFPEVLKPVRDFSAQWFGAFKSTSTVEGVEAREVSGRLYRTRRHAVEYLRNGLATLRQSLEVA